MPLRRNIYAETILGKNAKLEYVKYYIENNRIIILKYRSISSDVIYKHLGIADGHYLQCNVPKMYSFVLCKAFS